MRLAIASGNAPSKPYPTSMRTRRSFFATIRYAPSSTPLRPSFHASSTRMPNCSISSGWVVGTMSTAIWLPFFASKAASLLSMRFTASPDSVPVRSVTRAVSGGTATSAPADLPPAAILPRSSSANRDGGATGHQAPTAPAVGVGLPKSTLGGLEITASFSTAKFGFGL